LHLVCCAHIDHIASVEGIGGAAHYASIRLQHSHRQQRQQAAHIVSAALHCTCRIVGQSLHQRCLQLLWDADVSTAPLDVAGEQRYSLHATGGRLWAELLAIQQPLLTGHPFR